MTAPRVPHKCIWEITRACNLRCLHCENRSGPRSPAELPDRALMRVVDELAALGCREAVVTGGEPLLRPAWRAVCEALVGAGMRVSLVTNGTLLDQRRLEDVLEAGVELIGISIDGLQATHDGIRHRAVPGDSPWREAVAALELALKALPTVAITQVNRRNLGELAELGRFLADLGVRRWQIQLAIPVGRVQELEEPFVLEPEQLEQLSDFIVAGLRDPQFPLIDVSDTIGYCTGEDALFRRRRRADGSTRPGLWLGCTAGLTAVAITYDGRVRGCSMLPPELDAGSLHQESLTAIWADPDRFAYSTRFHPDQLRGGCAACGLGGLCRGGCTTMAYYSTGTVAENPYCLRMLRCPP